jgi:DNA-binding transcriptional LysR family regulator
MGTTEPDLDLLRLLAAVAETGSLGRAAANRGISQPAASQRMRTLERRLGLTLLDRSPTGSRLTPAGASVVDWARPLLLAADELSRAVSALRDRRARRLRVAASLTVADHLVPQWLVRLHAAHPDSSVALQVTNSERVASAVLDRQADIGFVEGVAGPAGLRSRVVGGDELVLTVAPGHPWARRRSPITPAELAEVPLVVREPGSGTREAVEHALATAGLRLRPGLELGSLTSIRAAVAAGEGPALLSSLAVADDLAVGRLRTVATSGLQLRRRFRAVWRADAEPASIAVALLAIALRSAAPPAQVRKAKHPDA